jgi:hypothetical protein
LRCAFATQGKGGGEAAALAAVRMATTNDNQIDGAVKETMVTAMVTGSGDDCNSGNDGSGDDSVGDDSGCGDGNGNTDSGSGSVDGNSDGGNCNSNGIAVVMVKAMAAAMAPTTAATAMAGGTDNNQLKGAWKKRRQR